MALLKLIPAETNIDFIGKRYLAFAVSCILLTGSIFLIVADGLNFGVDFTGGTVIEVRVPETPDLGELRKTLNDLNMGAVSLQEFGQPDDLMIRLPEQEGGPDAQKAAIDAVRGVLDEAFPEGEVEYRRTEFVGPQVGEELKLQGLYAILFSLAGILAYIWLRFEWQFGVAAVVALAHDAIATIGLFAVTQMEFNLSTVAAILMIAGYSINDTVVVFDRIRETLRQYRKMKLSDVLNCSINRTLSRTLMTSLTTLLALVALWAFGGEVIRGFVNALIFGIVVGTYSSIFIASPILLFMNLRSEETGEETDAEEDVSETETTKG